MSDNIIIDPEIWRLYVLFMSIPNETWTDVLKLLSRQILVQNISPACKRLKNISNRNVDNVHVIKQAGRFTEKLRRGDPLANQQLQHLAGDNCHLASQFRLNRIDIIRENMAILQHCIELFRGCQLLLFLEGENMDFTNECLTHLEPAKPIIIYIYLSQDPQFQSWRHPTIWNCNRIKLLRFRSVDAMPIVVPFLDWLHHQPIEVDGDDGAEQGEEVRCLIIQRCVYRMFQEAIDWLINACVHNFQQSQGPKDRCRFVLSFSAANRDQITLLDQFERRHNRATGEVLLLERVEEADYNATNYRLRRCLAEEVAHENEFYGKIFKRNGPLDEFAVSEDDGPMVVGGSLLNERGEG